MSHHVWTQKNIAAYVAGGLDAEERADLEAHLRQCPACALNVEEARALDHKLAPVLKAANPGPALEDRLIQALQAQPPLPRQRPLRLSTRAFVFFSAAAAILLAVAGVVVEGFLEPGGFRFPGEPGGTPMAQSPSQEDKAPDARHPTKLLHGSTHHGVNFEVKPAPADDAMSPKGGGESGNYSRELSHQLDGFWGKGRDNLDLVKAHNDIVKKLESMSIEMEVKPSSEQQKEIPYGSPSKKSLKDAADKANLPMTSDPSTGSAPDASVPSFTTPPGKQKSKIDLDIWRDNKQYSNARKSLDEMTKRRFNDELAQGKGDKKNVAPNFDDKEEKRPGEPKVDMNMTGKGKPGDAKQGYIARDPKEGYGKDAGEGGRKTADELAKGYYERLAKLDKQGDKSKFSEDLDKTLKELRIPPSPADLPSTTKPTTAAPPSVPPTPPTRDEEGKQKDTKKKGENQPTDSGDNNKGPGQEKQTEQPAQPPKIVPAARKVIRTGDLEFEIDSFDNSVTTIMRLVTNARGSFVATINSDKLPNGKMKGSVVVRIPPDLLDQFVLDLRKELAKNGELKNQRIFSEDVTKLYTDIESRLRAARTMEERLISIIKDGKGVIKDLLQAEKELSVWRIKIEEMEGEIRYYANLVAFSTLTIRLYEKDIRVAANVTESERIQAGIEVEDVEKAYQDALKAILDAKGRVTRSELKQQSAGQFNAVLHFEVAEKNSGPIRDRLKQLGKMVRLQIDRVQQIEGNGTAPKNGKVEFGSTQFQISIYNLASSTPRETVILRIAAVDVPGVYAKLRDAIGKAKGTIRNAALNEQDRQNVSAQLDFDVLRTHEADIQAALVPAGDTLARRVVRLPESEGITDAKVRFMVAIEDLDAVTPRETIVLKVVSPDVPAAYQKLRDALGKIKTKVIVAQIDELDRRRISARLDFSIGRIDEAALQILLKDAGEQVSKNVIRLPEGSTVTDSKVLMKLTLISTDSITPRDIVTLKIAATDVPAVYAKLREAVAKAKARFLDTKLNEQDRQNIRGELAFDIPRGSEAEVQAALTAAGETLSRNFLRAPEGAEEVTDAKIRYVVDIIDTNSSAVQARETINIQIAAIDVPATYAKLRETLFKVKARVTQSELNEQDRRNVTGMLYFTFPRSEEGVVQNALTTAGETLSRTVSRIVDRPDVTDAKVAVQIGLLQADTLTPREKLNTTILAPDVRAAYDKLREALLKLKVRIINEELDEHDRRNVTGNLAFTFARADEPAVQTALTAAGEALSRTSTREKDRVNITDAKVLVVVKLMQTDSLRARETVTLKIATPDVQGLFKKLHDVVTKAKGRIDKDDLDDRDRNKIKAQLDFEVQRSDEDHVLALLTAANIEVLSRKVSRQPENVEVSDSKIGFSIGFQSAANLTPRVIANLILNVNDVSDALAKSNAAIKELQGRELLKGTVGKTEDGKVEGAAVYEVRLTEFSKAVDRIKGLGALHTEKSKEDPDAPEGKLAVAHIIVRFMDTPLVPRITTTLQLDEVADVPEALAKANAIVKEHNGRELKLGVVGKEENGKMVGEVTYEVPLAEFHKTIAKLKGLGVLRTEKPEENSQAPDGKLAVTRVVLKLSNNPLLSQGQGLNNQLRDGLASSLRYLNWSIRWLVIGLLTIGPWLILVVVIFLFFRWLMWSGDSSSMPPLAKIATTPAPPPENPPHSPAS